MTGITLSCVLCVCALAKPAAPTPPNVLRNGSFEGSLKYWIHDFNDDNSLDTVRPAFGLASVRIPGGRIMSTPFALASGRKVTVAFSVRAEQAGELTFNVRPSKRDLGQQPGMRFGRKDRVGTEWTRIVFEFTPPSFNTSKKEEDFDAITGWMLDVKGPEPLWLDGVVITQAEGTAPIADYVARTAVEVALDAPGLTKARYAQDGNLLTPGDAVPLTVAVSNPGKTPRDLKLVVTLTDYEGIALPAAPLLEKSFTLAPGRAVIERLQAVMPAGGGHFLARATVRETRGARTLLDQSDQPLSALPFPKAATTPDPRERFGASFRGPHTIALGQQIGFRWARWGPSGWDKVQTDGPDTWDWTSTDDWVKSLADAGMGYIQIAYVLPKWAKPAADDKNVPVCPLLPSDMQWPVDDPRWTDLSLTTRWDAYLTALVKRYPGESMVFQLYNEPDLLRRGFSGHIEFYRQLALRSYAVVKKARPEARFSVNNTYPWVTALTERWGAQGGAAAVDIFTWHNYHDRQLGSAKTIRQFSDFFARSGHPTAEIWFDEGGVFINSSQDNAAPAVGSTLAPEWAHLNARSLADMLAAGQGKHILFHIAYEDRGRSWWDLLTNGGTELWDENHQPNIGAVAWNVLCDSLGLSENIAPLDLGAVAGAVFHDQRHQQGVAVVWNRSGSPATLALPGTTFIRRDVVGRDTPLPNGLLELPADGRPYFLFTSDNLSGSALNDRLKTLSPSP